MCAVMDMSASRWTPRSQTAVTGDTAVSPIRTGPTGICCWRRTDAHQRISFFVGLSCNLLDVIHSETSSIQVDRRSWRTSVSCGWQNPYICVSSAYACGWSWWKGYWSAKIHLMCIIHRSLGLPHLTQFNLVFIKRVACVMFFWCGLNSWLWRRWRLHLVHAVQLTV